MEHRHMSNQLMIPGHYQHENNHPSVEQSCIPMVRGVATENGHVFPPVDHSIRRGAHFNPDRDLGGRSNGYHSSHTSMGTHHHLPPPFSRPSLGPYPHTSTNGTTSFAPVGPVGDIHSAQGKRKTPSVFEGSSSSFYGVGSSTSSSSQMLIQEPDVDHLSWPPYRRANLSVEGQASMRNVRRRVGPEWDPCMTSAHVHNYDSWSYQPTTHSANYYSVPVHPFNSSADVTSREWNIVPYVASYNGRPSHPDTNDVRGEPTQFYAGGSSVDINGSHHNSFLRGDLSSSQNPHVSHVQTTRNGHSYHHQTVTPFYRNGPHHSNYNNGSSFSANELQFPSGSISSRYSMYSPTEGWGNGGGGYRGVVVDQSSFYHERSNLPDEYQDMRLDIDDMSYEELLALEERIGYVSSGLSEDGMTKCLREKLYYSMDQNHDACSICLEEYKDGEKIGRIEKCGHEYHVDCIKKWVMMKKVCPICKADC